MNVYFKKKAFLTKDTVKIFIKCWENEKKRTHKYSEYFPRIIKLIILQMCYSYGTRTVFHHNLIKTCIPKSIKNKEKIIKTQTKQLKEEEEKEQK